MKVHELITELQKYDPNLYVFDLADSGYWCDEAPMLMTPHPSYHDGSILPNDVELYSTHDKESEIIDHIRQNGYIDLGIL